MLYAWVGRLPGFMTCTSGLRGARHCERPPDRPDGSAGIVRRPCVAVSANVPAIFYLGLVSAVMRGHGEE
jgi:hypothetical protein